MYEYIFGAFLVAQVVKNPPAMQESWVRSLGWEDALESGMANNSSIRILSSVQSLSHVQLFVTP